MEKCKNCIYKRILTNASNGQEKIVCNNKDRLDAIVYASVYPDQPCAWYEEGGIDE